MMLHPFFADFDDGYQYYRPTSSYQQQRRRRALEEEARRAELERYYRMKEWEEQERLRRQWEYARRLRQQQMMEEEAYENELLRRRAAKVEAERMERLRAMRSSEECAGNDATDQEPVLFQLVRGPGNRLYRIPVTSTRKAKVTREPTEDKGDILSASASPTVFMEEDKECEIPTASVDVEPRQTDEESEAPLVTNTDFAGDKNELFQRNATIIVEDASDSEEEDDFKSPWRNRRPSPGQWMEPVESFSVHI